MSSRSDEGAGGRTGFTLVELLTVIVALIILTTLFVPAFARAREKSIQNGCRSNLKQIGLAVQLYADANAGILPGPVFAEAQAGYDITSRRELVWFLAQDLGCPKPSTNIVIAPVFLCPASQRRAPSLASMSRRRSYLLNEDIDPRPDSRTPPFGQPVAPVAPPLQLSAVAACAPPADLLAATDADKANVNPTVACWKDLSCRPVHGNARNELFFDWHVEARSW